MSLIADALKRAQDQRRGGGDDGARRLLTPSGPLRVPARRRRELPRSVLLAAVGLGLSAVVFALVVLLTPRSELAAGEPLASTGGGSVHSSAGGPDPAGSASAAAVPAEEEGNAAATTAADPPGRPATGPASSPASSAEASPGAAGDRGVGGEPAAAEGPGFRLRLAGEGPSSQDAATLAAQALGAQQRGDLETALRLYRRALALEPSNPQLHNNLGTVYRALGQADEAYRSFDRALQADPGYAPAWNNLGLMLDAMERREAAEEAYREALRLDPSNAGARVNLANAYADRGLYRDAQSLLRAALAADPTLPEAHYGLARVLEATGDAPGARRHYELFLRHGAGEFGALEDRVRAHLSRPGGGG